MARAFWKGAITFGMVVIPVKMYVATEAESVRFHLLHKKCLTRPKQVLYCQQDDEYFGSKDTVRGYEFARGQYVVLKESDFERVPTRSTHAINILGFVETNEIDPIYYYGSHYLEPDEFGAKPFALLREALKKTQRLGLAKVTFQRREHLCCLRPSDDILVLHTIHYRDELQRRPELSPPEQAIAPEELEMAVSLVTAMATDFRPAEYKDEYRLALKALIEAKIKGEEIVVREEPKIEMPDLMAALRASLAAVKVK